MARSRAPQIDLDKIVIFDGLPVVPEDKLSKLKNFLSNAVEKAGKLTEITMPVADGKSKGFAFLEFVDRAGAATCQRNFDKWKMDKVNTVSAYMYRELKSCEAEAPSSSLTLQPRDHLSSWQLDPQLRDQLAIRFEDTAEVYWMESRGRVVVADSPVVEDGTHWGEGHVYWSPQGSYLLAYSRPADSRVTVWGSAAAGHGTAFRNFGTYPHAGPDEALFSPCERYLCTRRITPDKRSCVVVWDILSGTELKSLIPNGVSDTPRSLAWSHDGEYLSRTSDGCIEVYTLPRVELLDKAPLKAPGARDVCWAPRRRNVLSFWTPEPESGGVPASITLVDIPSRVTRSHNLFSVEDCMLHWHPDGDYLALQFVKVVGRKRTASLNLFRARERDMPVEMLEFAERIVEFTWEPKGKRFAVVHTGTTTFHSTISFYTMAEKKLELLFKVLDKPCNRVVWSPAANTCVLCGLDNLGGVLEFYDVKEARSLITTEHLQATLVSFDPSGRFVVTAKTQPLVEAHHVITRDMVDNGFMLWTFAGQRIHEEPRSRCYQILWRPRLHAVLTDEEAEAVVSTIKSRKSAFSGDAKKLKAQEKLEKLRELNAKKEEFESFLRDARSLWTALGIAPRTADAVGGAGDVRHDWILSEVVERAPI